MRKLIIVALALVLAATSGTRAPSINAQPRIWLTNDMLATLAAKRSAGDPDYLLVQALADNALTLAVPRVSIVGASNSNPVVFTTSAPVPWTGTLAASLYLKVRQAAGRPFRIIYETRGYSATRTGRTPSRFQSILPPSVRSPDSRSQALSPAEKIPGSWATDIRVPDGRTRCFRSR
jgi:hypothetical protein